MTRRINRSIEERLEYIRSNAYKIESINKCKELANGIDSSSTLGYFVGEYIVSNYLPSLCVDTLQTNKNIKVTEEERLEFERLEKAYMDDPEHNKEEFKEYLAYLKSLEKKYFPSTLQCSIRLINFEDINLFKKGLILSLWDSDRCTYSIKEDDIIIYTDITFRHTVIELSLDV